MIESIRITIGILLKRPARLIPAALVGLVAALTLVALSSCQVQSPVDSTLPAATRRSDEPTVRVRILRNEGVVPIAGPRSVRIGPVGGGGTDVRPGLSSRSSHVYATPVAIRYAGGRFLVRAANGREAMIATTTSAIAVEPVPEPGMNQRAFVRINNTAYPGGIFIHPHGNNTGASTIDVVNHVRMEDYLPGVLQKELYSHWHRNAFMAQAVAARTYAIYQLSRTKHRHYDLESTVASQAYVGVATNPTAIAAVRDTRGMVLTWEGRIFPAYYSSCTGGVGQDAVMAFPRGEDIPPLRGRKQGGWGNISKNFAWGPVVRNRQAFSARLRAWGQANRNPIGNLPAVRDIRVARATPNDRPAAILVIGTDGKSYRLRPESFRFACNYDAPGVAKLSSQQKLKSSFIEVAVRQDVVSIRGRGYGHGVGMSQHGAQHMATQGHNPASILAFYYPQSEVTRVY